MLATVAIDCMGGDHGIRVTVPAALKLLSNGTEPVKVILVGSQSEIENQIASAPTEINEYIEIVNAPEVVEMEEGCNNTKKYSECQAYFDEEEGKYNFVNWIT